MFHSGSERLRDFLNCCVFFLPENAKDADATFPSARRQIFVAHAAPAETVHSSRSNTVGVVIELDTSHLTAGQNSILVIGVPGVWKPLTGKMIVGSMISRFTVLCAHSLVICHAFMRRPISGKGSWWWRRSGGWPLRIGLRSLTFGVGGICLGLLMCHCIS